MLGFRDSWHNLKKYIASIHLSIQLRQLYFTMGTAERKDEGIKKYIFVSSYHLIN